MSIAEAKERARIEGLGPGREEFRKMRGYYERPGKVWRTGVGYVDGYEWGVRVQANDGHGRLSREAEAIGEMMAPSWEAGTEHEAATRGFPGEYCGKVTGKRRTREASEPIACPTCGFNRFMGRCTCEH